LPFDPANPVGLSGLRSQEGDFVGETMTVSQTVINGSQELTFEPGVLVVKPTDPAITLPALAELYGAEVQDELDGYYKLKVDLSKSPLPRLEALIRAYNDGLLEDITALTASSLQALQTYAIPLDIAVHYPHLIESMGVNQIPELASVERNIQTKDTLSPYAWHVEHVNIGLNRAWNYSMGTGATIAVLDGGFVLNHPEIQRRLVLNAGNTNILRECISCKKQLAQAVAKAKGPLGERESLSYLYHGYLSMAAAAGERDNSFPSVGVAPNARIAPFAASNSFWDAAVAVRDAAAYPVDVITMSMYTNILDFSSRWDLTRDNLMMVFQGGGLGAQIRKALDQKVIVLPLVKTANHATLTPWSECSAKYT
jgi:subtilisin family serine protease